MGLKRSADARLHWEAVGVLTFADKEDARPERGISRSKTDEYPFRAGLLESGAGTPR